MIVVGAPVAVGKSLVSVTLAEWRKSLGERTTITTHNNVLVDQYLQSFPTLPALHRKAYCGGDYQFTLARARASDSSVLLANYYTYVANKQWRENLIIDEAHNTLGMLKERWAKKLWQREWEFPDEMNTFEDLLEWAETKRSPELDQIMRDVVEEQTFTLQYDTQMWRGKPDRVLKLIPLTVRGRRPWLWNRKVKKIVLLSATISEWEVYELGLDTRRVLYVNVDSPIPAANRPVIVDPVANMSWATRSFAIDRMASRLRRDLETRPSKGVIHATYDVAARLRGRLRHPRLIWHDKYNKQQKYQEFRNAPADSGVVFVASGFSEGIDLAYDAARWQVITDIPFPSLGDPAIAIKREQQPDWYLWETVKTLRQTIGRVCRAPDDYGETWVYDNRFRDTFAATRGMWSADERNSIRWN